MKRVIEEIGEMSRRFFRWAILTGFVCALALVGWGCATPIGVRYVEPRVAYHSLTANILSAERPSSFSARELMNLNLYERFEEEPEKALAEMHSGLAPKGDEDRVFALAELSFLHAENSGERSYYLASAVYAYAFILPGPHGTAPRGIDPRFRWAADIYNQALTRAAMLDNREYPVPRGGTFKLPFGEHLHRRRSRRYPEDDTRGHQALSRCELSSRKHGRRRIRAQRHDA